MLRVSADFVDEHYTHAQEESVPFDSWRSPTTRPQFRVMPDRLTVPRIQVEMDQAVPNLMCVSVGSIISVAHAGTIFRLP